MAKIKNMSYNYDEITVSKNYFEYIEENRRFVRYLVFKKNTNQGILKFVLKYLLHELRVTPYECESIIRKYTVLVTYDFLRFKYPDNFSNVYELDKILSEPFKLNILRKNIINTGTLIEKLYNKDDSILYNKYVDMLCEESQLSIDDAKAVKNFLKKDNYYFSFNGTVEMLEKNTRSFDQLISEVLLDSKFNKFSISIDDSQIENFCANFHNSLSGKVFNENIPLLFAFLVNNIIENNNYSLKGEVELVSSDSYKIILKNKDANISNKDCFSFINFVNSDYKIIRDKIVEFEFMFNNKQYIINSKGLLINS